MTFISIFISVSDVANNVDLNESQYLYALGETVTDGTVNLTLNWSVNSGQTFPVIKDTVDLCDQMVELRDPCPLSIGNHKEHYSGYVHEVYPKASQITMNKILVH